MSQKGTGSPIWAPSGRWGDGYTPMPKSFCFSAAYAISGVTSCCAEEKSCWGKVISRRASERMSPISAPS